jgi:plastocyanin
LNVNDGDIIEFNVNAPGHPFFIKTVATTGTGNQLATYVNGVDFTGGGVSNNSATSGTVTLYTSTLGGTTLYYICQFHGGMTGQIVIS